MKLTHGVIDEVSLVLTVLDELGTSSTLLNKGSVFITEADDVVGLATYDAGLNQWLFKPLYPAESVEA